MQTILWDLLLADRYASQYISKDTTKHIKIENLKLYDQVFQIHKITKAQFIESFDYYLQRPDLTIQVSVLRWCEGLSSVAKGFLGAGVHLDNQPVGPDGNASSRKRFDHVIVAGGV